MDLVFSQVCITKGGKATVSRGAGRAIPTGCQENYFHSDDFQAWIRVTQRGRGIYIFGDF